MDINDAGKVLDDLPEVAATCGAECTIAEKSILPGLYDLCLHPKTVLPIQQAQADWIGSFFGRFPGRRVKPTVSIVVERGAITQVMLSADDHTLEGPVKGTWKPQRSGN